MPRNWLLFLPIVSLIFSACSSSPPEIKKDDVVRIVSTLAADDMEGRRAYTPGIERAASFIEGELKAIGLEPLSEQSGFRQTFSAYQLKPTDYSIVLNGNAIPKHDIFFLAQSDSLAWTTGDVEILRVGPDDDIGKAFGRAQNTPNDLMIVADKAHEGTFRRIQLFLSDGSRMLEMGKTGSVAFVLTNDLDVKTVDAKASFEVDTLSLTNLVGKIPGKRDDEIVLFSAHYDHLGIRPPVEGDSVANGANDDASGVAAVIELARYFKAMGKPERTLMFALFTAEEMGGYGSHYFAEHIDPDQIVAMFNIEMIGKQATQGPKTAWITGFDKSDFGEILQRAVKGTEFSFYPDPYPHQNLFFRSDNATLARRGVPAHSISTTPIDVDKDYHKVTDEIGTLDFDNLTNTIKAIAAGAKTIVSGDETPTRIKLPDVIHGHPGT
jgi:hypothetical protein